MNTGPYVWHRERKERRTNARALLAGLAILLVLAVPAAGEEQGPGQGALQPRAKVDINTATAEELQRLPGMTPSLSRRIVANRPYRKIDDLVRRRVLGRKQMAGIKEFIRVGSAEPTHPRSR